MYRASRRLNGKKPTHSRKIIFKTQYTLKEKIFKTNIIETPNSCKYGTHIHWTLKKELSKKKNRHKGSSKKKWYFLGIIPKPPTLNTFRNKNVNFCQKKSGFQDQKQWTPKFHMKFRNTGPPPPPLLFRTYS